MMKKLAAILLALMLLPLAVCAEAPAEPAPAEHEHTMEKKTFPHLFVYDEHDEPAEEEMNLYFADGGDIPYTALSEYVPFLVRLVNRKRECEIPLRIEFAELTNLYTVKREDNDSAMVVNPEADLIAFTNLNSFLQLPGSSALVDVLGLPDPRKGDLSPSELINLLFSKQEEMMQMTEEEQKKYIAALTEDVMQQEPEAENSFFAVTRLINRRGEPVSLKLADYGLDIIQEGGECYLPFQVMNDLLISPFYIQYVFNGKNIIGDVYGGKLMDRVYKAEPEPMSREFANYNFAALRLFMDYYYGLKQEHRIDSFFNYLFFDTGLLEDLAGTDSARFDNALSALLNTYLDDSHSGMIRKSWRTEGAADQNDLTKVGDILSTLGYSGGVRTAIAIRMKNERRNFYSGDIPAYEEVGDTAFITFDKFTAERELKDYYSLEDPDNPKDTVELILYAHRQITRENSPVKNIVIDLSNNGGGSVTAATAVAAWFTGNAVYQLRDTMTGAETIEGCRADINLNGKIVNDPEDTVSGGKYNLYCLVSPVSFSCGNLVPALFKQSGQVTLIGQKTGGGSNAVLPATTASGSLFQISGAKQISISVNGSFYNVDTGIEPDVVLTKYSSFFDRPALVEMIGNLK